MLIISIYFINLDLLFFFVGHSDKNNQPGPGSYSLKCNKNIGSKIGTSKRAFENQKSNVPRPGAYNYIENTPTTSPIFLSEVGKEIKIINPKIILDLASILEKGKTFKIKV